MTDFDAHSYDDTCRVCGWTGTFTRTQKAVRETYQCPTCKANLRYRVQAEAVLACYKDWNVKSLKELLTHPGFKEQAILQIGPSSPFDLILKESPSFDTVFFAPGTKPGVKVGQRVNMNPEKLAAKAESYNLVLTCDLLGKVRNPITAFKEIRRVLKSGGSHIFTLPTLYPLPEKSVKRVEVVGDEDKLLTDARYQGDGCGGKALVYNDFGQDLVLELSKAGYLTSVYTSSLKDRNLRSAYAFISVKVSNWLASA